jgi:competence protein ComEC
MISWHNYFPASQYLSLAMIGGIICASFFHLPIPILFVGMGICGIASLTITDNKIFLVAMFCFVLGFTNFQIQDSQYTITSKKNSRGYFYGEVLIDRIEETTNKNFPHKITVTQMTKNSPRYSLWLLCKKKPSLKQGDRIFLNGIHLHPPSNNSIKLWMKKEHIIASGFIKDLDESISSKHKTQQNEPSTIDLYLSWIDKQKNALYDNLCKKLSPEATQLFGLIFLGTKSAHAEENISTLRDTFMHWGLSHYLARAGLHFAMLFALLNLIFSLLHLPFFIRKFFLICSCTIYALLSWPSIPFIRALFSMVLCLIGDIQYIQTSLLHIINIICVLLLLWNPAYLFALDFQLSFLLTYLIILGNHITRLKKI